MKKYVVIFVNDNGEVGTEYTIKKVFSTIEDAGKYCKKDMQIYLEKLWKTEFYEDEGYVFDEDNIVYTSDEGDELLNEKVNVFYLEMRDSRYTICECEED